MNFLTEYNLSRLNLLSQEEYDPSKNEKLSNNIIMDRFKFERNNQLERVFLSFATSEGEDLKILDIAIQEFANGSFGTAHKAKLLLENNQCMSNSSVVVKIAKSGRNFKGEGQGQIHKDRDVLYNRHFKAKKVEENSECSANRQLKNEVRLLNFVNPEGKQRGVQSAPYFMFEVEGILGFAGKEYLGTIKGLEVEGFIHGIEDLLTGLEVIHSQLITLGDIKPGNIFYEQNNKLCLSDFGGAKKWDEIQKVEEGSEWALGSEGFSASYINWNDFLFRSANKEVWVGHEQARDVFALAVSIVQVITKMESPASMFKKVHLLGFIMNSELNEDTEERLISSKLSSAQINLLKAALNADYKERPTASEFLKKWKE